MRPPAYISFLASLALPGLGQVFTAAAARGGVFLALAAAFAVAVLSGGARLPSSSDFGGTDGAVLAAAGLLWIFAGYDAWFRARERDNGMLPHLPRTPRVAAFASLLCGGAGQVYLGRLGGAPVAVASLTLTAAAWHWRSLAAAGLVLAWNSGWAWAALASGVARYHAEPGYRRLQQRLAAAPLDSPLAPSPSLPMVTAVAAFIAVVGGLALERGLSVAAAASPQLPGWILDEHFVDPARRLDVALPGAGWSFATGVPPLLLSGHHAPGDESLSLAVAATPSFTQGDVIPAGALARFARRQEERLAATISGFQLLDRLPVVAVQPAALRLLFNAAGPGGPLITVQDYLVRQDAILILTLSGNESLGAGHLTLIMDDLLLRVATGSSSTAAAGGESPAP